jgi:hypothetical protein
MITIDLQGIAHSVIRRAQRQEFVLPRDVREELLKADLSPSLWKDVLALARGSLSYRQGRYYYAASLSPRLLQERRQQQRIHRAVRRLLRDYKADASQTERRRQGRSDFVQTVKVQSEDQREWTLLSRDLSITGIRLIGTRSLLGQKVRVLLPNRDEPISFLVRILWTCAVGDELFENGGTFLEVLSDEPQRLKVVSQS